MLENEDPALFEELSMRRKWSNVAKDPVKGLRDQHLNKNSYWNMLNHLPSKGVDRIVTEKILDMDKVSCDQILQSILEEKQLAEYGDSPTYRDYVRRTPRLLRRDSEADATRVEVTDREEQEQLGNDIANIMAITGGAGAITAFLGVLGWFLVLTA